MKVKGIIYEDFVNYKKCSMTIAMPFCSFKCDKEYGSTICQNSHLANEPIIEISTNKIIEQYISNPLSHSIVFQGLEPFDSFGNVYDFIKILREDYLCDDDVVIYSGYTEEELNRVDVIKILSDKFKNIIIKFGRYKPVDEPHYDEIMGVNLASDNQYAKQIC